MDNRKTILLVEDEALIAIAQKKTLEKYGYAVVMAHSGEKAMETVRTTAGISLILMDINLGRGKMDGTETAERILEDHDIPVLFLSSYTQAEIVEKTEKITSYGYVVKDSGETVLNASIKMAFKLHEAHRELKETKDVAQRYLNVAAEIIVSLDTRGRITLLNDSGHKLLGYENGELIGKGWFDTCTPERLKNELNQVFAALAEGGCEQTDVLTYENPVVTKNGEELTILWHNTVIRNDEGKIIAVLSSGENITERKRAEEALRESEKAMRAFFDAVHETVVLIDTEGTIILANTVVAERLGTTVEKLAGTCLYDHFPPDVASYRKERYDRAMETGLPAFFEDTRGPRSFEHHCQPVLTADGKVAGLTIFAYETTSHKKTETALRESEEKYRSLFENAIEGIFQTTPEGKYLSANPALARFFGYDSPQELMEATIDIGTQRYTDPGERQKFMDAFEAQGVIRDFEVRLVRKDGNPVWTSMNARAVRDEQGAILYYEGTVENITTRKMAEEEATREREKLRTLFDNAPFGMVLIDEAGRFIYVNARFTELLGYDLSDVPDGRAWFRKAYPDAEYRHSVVAAWKEDLGNAGPGERRPRTFTVACKDGLRKIVNFIPSRLSTGDNLMTCEDITNRKRVEDELKRLKTFHEEITESIVNGVWVSDKDDVLIYCNRGMGVIAGVSPHLMVGTHLWRGFSEETVAKFKEHYMSAKESLKPVPYDAVPVVTPAGRSTYQSGWLIPLVEEGQFHGMICTVEDITERKQAETVLRESEEKFRLLVENLPQRIFLKDRLSNYMSCNRHYARDMGIEPEAITGRTDYEFYPRELAEKYRADDREVIESGRAISVEEKYLSSGRQQWIWTTKVPYRDANGDISGVMGIFEDITERKNITEKLFKEQERLRIIFDASPAGIIIVDRAGTITFANEKTAEMFGCTLAELIGSAYPSHVHPDQRSIGDTRMHQLIEGTVDSVDTERYYVRKDGTGFWGYLSGRRQGDESGTFVNLVGIITDITSRKEAETALKESEEKYRLIFENALEGIFRTSPEGRYLAANPTLAGILGYDSPQDLIGSVTDIGGQVYADAGDREKVFRLMRDNGHIKGFETRFHRKDGSIIWVSLNAHPVYDAHGGLLYFEGTAQDTTDRHRAEDALRASEETIRTLLNATSDAVFLLDKDMVYLAVNEITARRLGRKVDQIVGTSVFELIQGEVAEKRNTMFSKVLDTGKPVAFTDERDGLSLENTLYPVFGAGEKVRMVAVYSRDITTARHTEEALRTSLREKEVLLKEIHHRVKNNLMVVSSILNLQSETIGDRKARDLIEDCRKRIHAMSLVHNRLYRSADLARISFSEYTGDLLSDIARSYGDRPGNIALVTDVGGVAFDIDTAIPIGLIMNELVSNAMKHAFPGERKGTIAVSLHQEEGGFRLSVRDDGIGFPEDLDFASTESLGMQLVITLVEQLDGNIELVRGHGTEFRITF